MKCKYCGEGLYGSGYSGRTKPELLKFNGIDINLAHIPFNKIPTHLSIMLIDHILNEEDIEIYKSFNEKITVQEEGYCRNCNIEWSNGITLYMRLILKDAIKYYLEAKISNVSLTKIGYDIQLLSYLPKMSQKDFIFALEDFPELQNSLLKLSNVYDYLGPNYPEKYAPERGGDGFEDFIKWLTEEIPREFAVAFIALLFSHGKQAYNAIVNKVQDIKYSKKIKKRIKQKILDQSNNTNWSDITIQDLEKHFYFPREFSGDPKELVDKIIDEKINELRDKLISRYTDNDKDWTSIFWPDGK